MAGPIKGMSRAESRERAEDVYYMRAVLGMSWRAIMREKSYGSVGAVQSAYKRHLKRNEIPDGPTTLAEILERRRFRQGVGTKALASAVRADDFTAVSSLLRTLLAEDAELAKLVGLNSPERHEVVVSPSPRQAIEEARRRTLESMKARTIDAEVIE